MRFLRITSNQPDAGLGEDGKDDECDNGGHIIIVSENSEILEISEFFQLLLILFRWAFISSHCPAPTMNRRAICTKPAKADSPANFSKLIIWKITDKPN